MGENPAGGESSIGRHRGKVDSLSEGIRRACATGADEPESGPPARMNKRGEEMIVAGVMSGTSADGIDVAIARIRGSEAGSRVASKTLPRGQECPRHIVELVGHRDFPYPRAVRTAVLAAMNAAHASVADLSRLNFLLGELYADALLATQQKLGVKIQLIG